VEDNVLLDEEKVTFNLLVELVGDLDTACMVWSRLSPCATNLTSLDDLWDKVQYSLRHTYTVKELCHHAN
jgi:hypothetical protein